MILHIKAFKERQLQLNRKDFGLKSLNTFKSNNILMCFIIVCPYIIMILRAFGFSGVRVAYI